MVGFNWYWNTRWYLFWLCTECTTLTQELTCHSVPIIKCLEAPVLFSSPPLLQGNQDLECCSFFSLLLLFMNPKAVSFSCLGTWSKGAHAGCISPTWFFYSTRSEIHPCSCTKLSAALTAHRVPLHTYTSLTHCTVDGLWHSPSLLFGYHK